jgi:hypothetical protein
MLQRLFREICWDRIQDIRRRAEMLDMKSLSIRAGCINKDGKVLPQCPYPLFLAHLPHQRQQALQLGEDTFGEE